MSLEWRVLVGIHVCSSVCTFWAAFVEPCVGAQLLVRTSAGQVCVSRCAWGAGGWVGVGGPALCAEPAVPAGRRSAELQSPGGQLGSEVASPAGVWVRGAHVGRQ